MGGQNRSVATDLVLFVVTLGVYWFIWTRVAFAEVAAHLGRRLDTRLWIGMLVTWVGYVAANIAAIPIQLSQGGVGSRFGRGPTIVDAMMDSVRRQYSGIGLVIIGIGLVFYTLQAIYLRGANELVRDAGHAIQERDLPSTGMTLAFCALFAAGIVIPLLGGLASLVGLVLAIVWVVAAQNTMNRLWSPRPGVAPAPPAYGMPPPIMVPFGSQGPPPRRPG